MILRSGRQLQRNKQRNELMMAEQQQQMLANIEQRLNNLNTVQATPPPLYYGYVQDFPEKWLTKFEAFSLLNHLTDEQRIRHFVLLLRGDAEQWFTMLDNNDIVQNWPELRAAFIARFNRQAPRWRADQELQRIVQKPSETVEQYACRLKEICHRYRRNEDELMSLFLQGLRQKIKKMTIARDPVDFHTAFTAAKTAEIIADMPDDDYINPPVVSTDSVISNMLQKSLAVTEGLVEKTTALSREIESLRYDRQNPHFANYGGGQPRFSMAVPKENNGPQNGRSMIRQNFNPNQNSFGRNSFTRNRPVYGGREIASGRQVCRFCGKIGHSSPNCLQNPRRGCFNCGEIGHISKQCQHSRQVYSKNM